MVQKFQNFLSWHVYQIYPRSFRDSNGDGIGDLQGVISKLDYLQDLGINAIWLCPCYKSPNEDNGYDVADYRDIMDEFGTMEDIKELIRQLHKRGMRLIMDLVPNHTSAQHKWFQESRKSKDNPYSDYYYWFDSPPNAWESAFGGSAYQYDESRKQYYLHSYAIGQPDLNWENPKVVQEMQAVVDFWVDLGVDGFRVDVIDQISKDFSKNNYFGPRLHEFIHDLFGREKAGHLFTVGECWADNMEEVRRHIAPERDELSTLFQFDHQSAGRYGKFDRKQAGLNDLWTHLLRWEKCMQEQDLLYTLFTDNHDQSWMLDRVGNRDALRYESATAIAAMVYLLRGVCFIYQGQEMGMINSHHGSISEFDDVESINMYDQMCQTMTQQEALDKINFGGRDNTRRPMCWNGDGSEFTTGKPWIPFHACQKQINLEKDRSNVKSVHDFYRRLLHLRLQHPALTVGAFEEIPTDGTYAAYRRSCGEETILVVVNFEQPQDISLPGMEGKLLLTNYEQMAKQEHTYRPYEVTVYSNG